MTPEAAAGRIGASAAGSAAVTPPPAPTLRDADAADGGGIAELFGTVFGKPMSVDQWRWKYRAATAMSLYSAVAVTPDGSIVAHVGAIRSDGWDGARRLPVWQFTDAMVHPGFRRLDLFQSLIAHICRRIAAVAPEAMLYAFAGPDSKRIGHGKGFLTPVMQVRQYALDGAAIGGRGFGWSLEPAPLADPRFAAIWRRQMGGTAVFAVRDEDYLDWRYRENAVFAYRGAILKRFGRERGWLIWSRRDGAIQLVDLCLAKKDLAAALRSLAALEAPGGEIRFWLADDWAAAVDLPLTAETTPACLMLFNASPARSICETLAPRMFFTMADVDIF